jgi:hypothetical protein
MSVDPRNPRTVLCIHGVQIGDNDDQQQHEQIRALIESRLGNIPLNYQTEMFRYEDINDEAQALYQQLVDLIMHTPTGHYVAQQALDLCADVVTAYLDTSTAAEIRDSLRAAIIDIFDAGNPCYLVAHSLGTIYAFDVVNDLMKEPGFFDRDSRRSWPVQGLVTMGSPIGLDMFQSAQRDQVTDLGSGDKWFRWLNYWDRTDPVVSGKIFGAQQRGFEIAEHYQSASPEQGWVIRDRVVDTGKHWLLAHVAYWDNPMIGDGIVDMITN